MNTIKYVSSDQEWEFMLKELERKNFESEAEIIGKIQKYRYLSKNSTGIKAELYKKEMKKWQQKLKGFK